MVLILRNEFIVKHNKMIESKKVVFFITRNQTTRYIFRANKEKNLKKSCGFKSDLRGYLRPLGSSLLSGEY